MLNQPVRQLRDRENEDQVEEELDEADPIAFLRIRIAQQAIAGHSSTFRP
jgi:hypothetical protein